MYKISLALLLFLPIEYSSAKKIKHPHGKYKNFELDKEKTELFAAVQTDLQNEFAAVKKRIKEEYLTINNVSQKLNTLKTTHAAALELEKLVLRIEKKLTKEEIAKKNGKLKQTKLLVEKAIQEAEKAHNNIQKSVEGLNKELDELFGQTDNPFKKAHATQAQKNINLATQEFNKLFTHKKQI